jgi:excinuclease ABC subunit A
MIEELEQEQFLEVLGAREHNLKDIDIKIPRDKLVVITGLSGSGKSSLAFDTIYAEGQRRYIESFAAYARQFIGNLERPDVDQIIGLSPVISIEQKTVNKNPRSTVGTVTEVYDFLRLLFARAADAYSYVTGEKMVQYNEKQILDLIFEKFNNKKIIVLAPIIKARKGHYKELFDQIRKQGFTKVRVNGEIIEIHAGTRLDRYKTHDIEIVIDRLEINNDSTARLTEALKIGMKHGKGIIMIQDFDNQKIHYFSKSLMCPSSGISYDIPAPNLFSFNSPYGACPKCNGIGILSEVSLEKIIPKNNISIKKGGIVPLGEYKNNWIFNQIETIAKKYDFKLTDPISEIPQEAIDTILYGSDETFSVEFKDLGFSKSYSINFEGVINFITREYNENPTPGYARWAQSFMNKRDCDECHGTRLKKQALYFKINNKNIAELAAMDIQDLFNWFKNIENKIDKKQQIIAKDILKEIRNRLQFLLNVGLGYLSLNRSSKTLSGGESQRIRLATQIGSQLVGVLYILDEPSIGLHQRDNAKLIDALKNLRDIGNSVIVVEHDKEIMQAADHIIDIGPKAGVHGGKIVAEGNYEHFISQQSLTTDYLTGKKTIEIPKQRRKGNGKTLAIKGASGNNLKNINVDFHLNTFICVTGVSGSGKSTLINETLYPILNQHIYKAVKKPLPYKKITGLEYIDKVIEIDQTPIGRTPRSNPSTYTGVFNDIRDLFAQLPEAKIRGYKAGRFSFNVVGGRCETCKGAGMKTIEMNFLPDVYVECEDCNGQRYNRETLEIRYKGKSISDVLNMTIEKAVDFFENIPNILNKIKTLNEIGLGYIKLGQSSTTLSGGEAQRVKLAAELYKRDTGNTFYILDEPTTGLHFEDINILLKVLHRLVDNGNTVLVIEHNLDIIKVADYIIDIGLEGGINGGEVIAVGTPEEIAKNNKSYTGKYLHLELNA